MRGLPKGSERAKEAGRKAAATRAKNKGIKPVIKEKKERKPRVQVVNLNLKKLEDSEAFIMYTDGPTKIQYSPHYRALKISPHVVVLTGKKK